jgi:hypothetical protein
VTTSISTHHRGGRRTLRTVLVSALITTAVAGCSMFGSADPTPSPSTPAATTDAPTSSPEPSDPAEAAKQQNIDDARARYEEFLAIGSKHAKAGTSAFEELLNKGYLGDNEIQTSEQSYWEQFTKQKLKQVGDGEGVVSVQVLDYEGDTSKDGVLGHRVHMEVCLDNTGLDIVKPDGSSILQEGVSQKVIMDVLMQGQETGLWSVRESTGTGRSC